MNQPLGTRSLDSFRDPVRHPASGARVKVDDDATPLRHVGEVIESSTAQLVAESVRLNGAPAFGQFVRVETEPGSVLGVVHNTRTQSLEANRRPSAYGKSEEELRLEQPQIFELLRTHFDVSVLGYLDGSHPVLAYPPQPARIHSFVYLCEPNQVMALTSSQQLLRSVLDAPGLPTDELLLAILCHGLDVRDDASQMEYVLRAGKGLSRLLRDDYDRLGALVGRLKERMNAKGTT